MRRRRKKKEHNLCLRKSFFCRLREKDKCKKWKFMIIECSTGFFWIKEKKTKTMNKLLNEIFNGT
jgi:hypothetical protein